MDTFSVDKSFYEDLTELWDSDMEPVMHDVLRSSSDVVEVVGGDCWGGSSSLDAKPGAVVLHDRLMTDAALGAVPIKTEHSYSLASDGDSMPESPISLETMDDDMDEEILLAIPMNRATQHRGRGRPESPNVMDIKQEPLSSPPSPSSDEEARSPISVGGNESPIHMQEHTFVKQEPMSRVVSQQQSLLKQPTIFLTARSNVFGQQGRMVIPKLNIKVESSGSGFSLPPTPPSSTTSDSEGNLSPMHASPSSPLTAGGVRTLNGRQAGTRLYLSSATASSSTHCRQPIQTPLISTQPKGSTGSLFLTEEEKRTLLAEGYPIPTRLPLTKAEEKSLKKIRRKIKNKISAQESRRKKKEYMDALEKRVENLVSENTEYKKKIDSLEGSNTSLLSQLHKLQAMLGHTPTPAISTSTPAARSRPSASTSHHFTRNSLK